MKMVLVVILTFLLTGCYETLHYGYLPGGDYQYYKPLEKVDLGGEKFRLEIMDNRKGFSIACSNFRLDRNTELEGETGYDFFRAYVRAMIEANNGIVDPESDNIIRIELTGLSAQYEGYQYVRVYGLVEFNTYTDSFQKRYCSVMVDGDDDAPLGKYSFDTRKGALRKLVSGSSRRALEEFMHDLAKFKKKKELQT
jgi:hypothetical protein